MKHFLTIDVEDWYRGTDMPGNGSGHDLRPAMENILQVLEECKTSATFFILADDAPVLKDIIRKCAKAGHGVACHGMTHRRVDETPPAEFRAGLKKAKAVIEDITGMRCHGFRAPYFSVNQNLKWFFEILAEEGFSYDSSLRIDAGLIGKSISQIPGIIEVPVPLVRLGFYRLGILGGLSLRILPGFAIPMLMRYCERIQQPACIYLHPYEWQGIPEGTELPWRKKTRRTLLVTRTLPRLRKLASSFQLSSIEQTLCLPSV